VTPHASPDCLVAGCRAGFEREAAADLARAAALLDASIDVDAPEGEGMVVGRLLPPATSRAVARLADARPVAARNLFVGAGPVALLRGDAQRPDRVAPLLAAIDALDPEAHSAAWRAPYVEHPDTNDGKALSPLARALAARIAAALAAKGRLRDDAPRRLHVFLRDGGTAWVGTSDAASTPWPLGIPRIRVPAGAPSRSAAKLAEALVVFLGESAGELLRPGMRAVDLGAAPGGWSWLLASKGLRVTAVDNGPLKGAAAADPLIAHVRADGLSYRPRRPVDWLVCDMVERPARIAALVADWIAEGAARHAIFNLKLPMKKRYDEVRACEALVARRMRATGTPFALALRQLYHDREEVTGFLSRERRCAQPSRFV
ncbi:MAG: 23S rRNA (cytidine(2498)-2'-O)-methyltransferase RlmM, partial [Betaproteobacteria bacterium]|nr:23S rRNA (cytidine(2498)-2'-O)-methyltransferase RlmM [Betaproteobacteria bacterium]